MGETFNSSSGLEYFLTNFLNLFGEPIFYGDSQVDGSFDSNILKEGGLGLAPIKPKPDDPPYLTMCKKYPLCSDMDMDFGCVSYKWKQFVFAFTIPLLIFNTIFFLVLLCYTVKNIKKIRKSTSMTKLQLFLLYVLVSV